jgi:death-on-curing protein
MITLKEALFIHRLAVKRFGGVNGVRDMSLLESAIQRPNATFGGNELYPSPVEKAAAIIESTVKNHPFSDGNKRTGYTLMRLMLLKFGLDIRATEEEKYAFVLSIAEGKSDFESVKYWIQKRKIQSI